MNIRVYQYSLALHLRADELSLPGTAKTLGAIWIDNTGTTPKDNRQITEEVDLVCTGIAGKAMQRRGILRMLSQDLIRWRTFFNQIRSC